MPITNPWESETARRVAAEYSPHGSDADRWERAVLGALQRAGDIPGAAALLSVSRRTGQRWAAWLSRHGKLDVALPGPGRPAVPLLRHRDPEVTPATCPVVDTPVAEPAKTAVWLLRLHGANSA